MKKTLTTLTFCLLCTALFNVSHASTAFEVQGSLEVVKVDQPGDFGLKIVTEEGELNISELQAKFSFCDRGIYLVVNNYYPEDSYTLLDIIDCQLDED
ncbi:MAG: hypothetical protein HN509_18850 [Halobacteriovoraceae bacterium]|jgi:hypothetical protein|nr:hypothetical protein [Halobacteriovoraceae bacterium]MBT5094707.1 hypothetical protein [Halobacteriovoraceae bacterium]